MRFPVTDIFLANLRASNTISLLRLSGTDLCKFRKKLCSSRAICSSRESVRKDQFKTSGIERT